MEEWKIWRLGKEFEKNYYINSVLDSESGLIIQLSDETSENKIIMSFLDLILSYRMIDESYGYKLICDLSKRYGSSFYSTRTFFMVDNSNYIKWVMEQSNGILDDISTVKHYVILGVDSFLEVIASNAPVITINGIKCNTSPEI